MQKLLFAISIAVILATGAAVNAFALESGYTDENDFGSIVYGNGIYAIVRNSKGVVATKDGLEWNAAPFPDGLSGKHELMFKGGKFLLLISDRLYASADAINWESSDYSGGAASLLFVNGRYLIFAEGGDFPLFTSVDALSWERSNYSGRIGDVFFALGKYFLIPKSGDGGDFTIYTSEDSVGWRLSFEAPSAGKVKKFYPDKALVIYLSDASLIYTFEGSEFEMKKIGASGEKLRTLLRHDDIYLMDTEIEGEPGNVYISGDGINFEILEVNGIPQTGAKIEEWRYEGDWLNSYSNSMDGRTFTYRYAIDSGEPIPDIYIWNIHFIATNAPGGPFDIHALYTDEWEYVCGYVGRYVLSDAQWNPEPEKSVYISKEGGIIPKISYDGSNYKYIFSGGVYPLSTVTDQKGTWVSTAVGNNILVSKSDFIFKEFTFESNRKLRLAIYENGKFWILTSEAYLYSSVDGIAWEEIPLPAVPRSFAWDGEKYLILTSAAKYDENGKYVYSTGGCIYTSEDGVNWDIRFSGEINYHSLKTEGPAYVAFGEGDQYNVRLAYSFDKGYSWEEHALSKLSFSKLSFGHIVYGEGRYVAVGERSYTSRDGVNWNRMNGLPAPELESQYFVRYINGMFFFYYSGKLYIGEADKYSDDIKWTLLYDGYNWINDVDFAGDDTLLITKDGYRFLSLSDPNKEFLRPKTVSGLIEVIKPRTLDEQE
ncbi:MAG: hypothetical protein LBU32_19835 [Clostridiales bacterium]|jgi:hypothetical protein|nr:hypothetical protein [Clostridiales bacterium]